MAKNQAQHEYGGNVALVTGAAGAIGAAVCLKLVNKLGFNTVIACDSRLKENNIFDNNRFHFMSVLLQCLE